MFLYYRVVCDILDPMVTGHTGVFRTHMIAQRPRSSVRARRPPHAAMSHKQHRGDPEHPRGTAASRAAFSRRSSGVGAWRRRRLFSRFAAFVYCSPPSRLARAGRAGRAAAGVDLVASVCTSTGGRRTGEGATTEESLDSSMEKTSRGSARWSMPGEKRPLGLIHAARPGRRRASR